MNLMTECKERDILRETYDPKVYCKAFEDNSGALEMARSPKMRPRTKHINLKYHWFRSWIAQDGEDPTGKVHVYAIGTESQEADLMTKQPIEVLFYKFRLAICGW